MDVVKKNKFFILLLGIEGLAFALIDWNSVISDLVYLKLNQKMILSFIAAGLSFMKFLATLICLKLNHFKNPNKIFITCVLSLCSLSILFGVCYHLQLFYAFAFFYILEGLFLEVFSAYHYAYVYHSLPSDIATEVHSKRISIFKFCFMIGTLCAGIFTSIFLQTTVILNAFVAAFIFFLLLFFILQVKNDPKEGESDVSFRQIFNFRHYSSYFNQWVFTRFIGKLALSSLVVVVSMTLLDRQFSVENLKIFKTLSWVLSAVGFWFSSYFMKKKLIVYGDIVVKFFLVLSLFFSLFNPYAIFVILLLNGLLNPFNTMSNFSMIELDKGKVAQKELLINLFGYFAEILSSFVLLNLNSYLALLIIIFFLLLSIVLEFVLYQKNCRS